MEDTNQEVSPFGPKLVCSDDKQQNDPWSPIQVADAHIPRINPAPVDPLRDMKSSETYIKTLEKKLNRLKDPSPKLKAGDMIKCLQDSKDLHVMQFLLSTSGEQCSGDVLIDYETDLSLASSVQRKFHPEKQAINPTELLPLIYEDVLSKQVESEDLENSENVT